MVGTAKSAEGFVSGASGTAEAATSANMESVFRASLALLLCIRSAWTCCEVRFRVTRACMALWCGQSQSGECCCCCESIGAWPGQGSIQDEIFMRLVSSLLNLAPQSCIPCCPRGESRRYCRSIFRPTVYCLSPYKIACGDPV